LGRLADFDDCAVDLPVNLPPPFMNTRVLVARNAFFMLLSQLATTALSFATVPLIARALGSTDYGVWWLGGAIAGVAALFIDWGLDGYIVFAVARSRERAPNLLAAGTLFRLGMGVAIVLPLEGALLLLGYDAKTRIVATLLYFSALVNSIAAGAIAVVRGLERMGGPAAARVGTEVMHTALVFTALALGATITGFAMADVMGAFAGLVFSTRAVMRVKVLPTGASVGIVRELLRGGAPFLLWSSILVLQPALESVLLSKLASHDAVGWYGASIRLVGFLLFPAGVLQTVFMPTLARLHAESGDEYGKTARDSLRVALLVGAPIGVGTFVFAEPGVALVFGSGFAQAATILRALGVYVLVVFVNIALSTILVSSGRTMTWSTMKAAMVAAGAAVSFVVIPYFQQSANNGGLGAAAVTVGAEVTMFVLGLFLLPKGILEKRTLLDAARVFGASAAMALASVLSAPFAVRIVASLLAYGVTLTALGGVGPREFELLRSTLQRAAASRNAASKSE
jgi:O-antigen/teichoic acid export membrane protein